MNKKTIKDINVKNKKVLVRVDFNVPMDDELNITDDTRICKSLDTIKYLLAENAAVILISHLGRPKGKIVEKFSLKPLVKRLSELLNLDVLFVSDCIGSEAKEAAEKLAGGEVLLLENLRFHPEEKANDLEFAEELADLGDIYVNNGFGVCHRAHASTEGITHFLPSVAGLLVEEEIEYLSNAVDNPKRPFVAIIGGAKVSDKMGVISSLLTKVDKILIGGGMANTFLLALGYEMGKSLVEEDKTDLAKELLAKAKANNVEMFLPVDLLVSPEFCGNAGHKVCRVEDGCGDGMALDIGPETAKKYAEALDGAKLIVWNGPMGVCELEAFSKGTKEVAKAVANCSGITIVGGGDSVAAVKKLGLANEIKHISTGGGASLEYLEGKVLPGIDSLDDLRRPMIAGNWKLHKTVPEAIELAKDIVMQTNGSTNEIVVLPPFTALESVADAIDGKHVGYGAQDLFWEDEGAFTGAVSGAMIADICCEYVIVGHSERRTIFGESNEIITKKIDAAYRNGLAPILCVGENAKEREAGKANEKIVEQLVTALKNTDANSAKSLVVAYEPLWAIGNGKTATVSDAQKICLEIKAKLTELYGEEVSRNIRVLYGGSVNDKNAEKFRVNGIDGVLVGGASLIAEKFATIARNF
jgi:triosephosphate isomerase